MNVVSARVRTRRWSLATTYGLAVVENTFELLYPFAMGLAVNGLLDDTWAGVAVFAAISLSHTAVSFTRQRYDTRSFARLYAEIATDLVQQQRDDGVATTAIVGRTNLASEYVEFLERDIPLAITAAFAVFGSLAMLFFYDPLIGLVAAAIALPVGLLNRRLMQRSSGIYRRLNDQTELEVAVIGTGTHDEVRRHFGIISRQWVRLSDAEATSWSVVEVIAAGLAVFALWRTTDGGAEVGTIFATIAYVWAYIGGFDQIPGVLQRLASLSDIRRRLDGLRDISPDDPTPPLDP
jgi:ABC-type multidrug transport system fused ATPase/permease subunit